MAQWYFGENGTQHGPVDDTELARLIGAQRIGPSTLVWHEGMPAWEPLSKIMAGSPLLAGAGFSGPLAIPAAGPANSGLAVASLVCGILAWVTCTLVPAIPAVICGHMALGQIARSPQPLTGHGTAVAGLITGYLALVPMLILLFIFGAAFLTAMFA